MDCAQEGDGTLDVFLPEGGLTGGRISAITPERTPRLFEILSEEESSLLFLAEMHEYLFSYGRHKDSEITREDLVYAIVAAQEAMGLEPDGNDIATWTEGEMKRSRLLNLPTLPDETRKRIFSALVDNKIVAERREFVSPEAVASAKAWFEGLPLTGKMRLFSPELVAEATRSLTEGPGAIFADDADMALDDIATNITPSWSDGLSMEETGAVLGDLFMGLPDSVKVALHRKGEEFASERAEEYQDLIFGSAPDAYFDVVMVGTWKGASFEDVCKLIPEGTDYIIDARSQMNYNKDTRLNGTNFANILHNRLGVPTVRQDSQLSFSSAFDMDEYAAREEVDRRLEDIKAAVAEGRRVAIIHGDGFPTRGNVAVGLGQALARKGLEVGYNTHFFNRVRTMSHREVILHRLGDPVLKKGSVEDIHFFADGSYKAGEGVDLKEILSWRTPEERRIRGHWNYGRGFNVDGEPVEAYVSSSSFSDNRKNIIRRNDMLFIISGKTKVENTEMREAMRANSRGKTVFFHVELDPTMLRSEDYAREMAARNFASILNTVQWRTANRPDFDPSNISLAVLGDNDFNMSTKKVAGRVSEFELQMLSEASDVKNLQNAMTGSSDEFETRFSGGDDRQAGTSKMSKQVSDALDAEQELVRYEETGVTEEDMTTFIANVMRFVMEGVSKESLNAERHREGREMPFTEDEVEAERTSVIVSMFLQDKAFLVEEFKSMPRDEKEILFREIVNPESSMYSKDVVEAIEKKYVLSEDVSLADAPAHFIAEASDSELETVYKDVYLYFDGSKWGEAKVPEHYRRGFETPRTEMRIGNVFSDCNPGVDRAALLAAQRLGLGFRPIIAKSFASEFSTASGRDSFAVNTLMMESERRTAVRSRMVTDAEVPYLSVPRGHLEAMLLNPFHLGKESARQMQPDAAAVESEIAEANARETSGEPGLTPIQVRALSRVGLSREDIILMNGYAVSSGVHVASVDKLYEFVMDSRQSLHLLSRRDISDTGLTLAYKMASLEMEDGIRGDGPRYVTLVDESFPAALKNTKGFSSDGGTEEAPSVLFYKGDLSLLDHPVCAALGRTRLDSVPGMVASQFSHHGIVPVTVLMNGSDMQLIRSMLDQGGRMVVVSPRPLTRREDREVIDEIVAKGGLVVSRVDPAYEFNDERQEAVDELLERRHFNDERAKAAIDARVRGFGLLKEESMAEHIATAIGGSLLVMDSKKTESQIEPSRSMAYLLDDVSGGVSAVRYGDQSVTALQGDVAGNEELISRRGALPVGIDGEGFRAVADRSRSVSPHYQALLASEAQKESAARSAQMVLSAPAKQDTVRFNVVRSGHRQIFIVPEKLDYVRDAVRYLYGEDVEFMDSTTRAMEFLGGHPVEVYGREVPTFQGWRGTEPVGEVTYSSQLIYHKDMIFSPTNAPESVVPVDPALRALHAQYMDTFRQMVGKVIDEVNESVDLAGYPQMRFSGGKYAVVTPVGVDVYLGDAGEVSSDRRIARAYLNSNGLFTIEEADYDLGLSQSRTWKDRVFHTHGIRRTDYSLATIEALVEDLKRSLMSSSEKEAEMYATAEREDIEEFERSKEAGYMKDSTSNDDVLADAVFRDMQSTIIGKANDVEPDRAKMIGKLSVKQQSFLSRIAKEEARRDKLVGKIKDLRASMSALDALEEERFATIKDEVDACEAELSGLTQRIDNLYVGAASFESKMRLVAGAQHVNLAASPEVADTIKLCVDGVLVLVDDIKVTKNEIAKVYQPTLVGIRASLREEAAAKKAMEVKALSVEGAQQRISAEKVEQYRQRRLAERFAVPTADENEVVETLRGGQHIIKREGRFAIASRDLTIKTPFYVSVRMMEGSRSRMVVENDKGQFNIVNSLGKELMSEWCEEIRPEHEHCSAVKRNGLWNHFDFSKGDFISDCWETEVSDFSEGLAVFRGGAVEEENEGKWNVMDRKGDLVTDIWFDEAPELTKDGFSGVSEGTRYEVTRDGNVLSESNEQSF